MPTVSTQSTVNQSIIDCQDVSVNFGGRHTDEPSVLRGLNLQVKAGEFVTLLGASGCGKSTLLRAIAGLQPTSSGDIRYQGSQTVRGTPISFVFQEATLLDWRSVWENVKLPLELNPNQSVKELDLHIRELLDSVSLTGKDDHKFPDQLSGGMKMRVALARALATSPTVLLLDEPFAALDDVLRNQLNDLLLKLWTTRKLTILFVTHNILEAIYLSSRIAIMHQGAIAEEFLSPLPAIRQKSLRSTQEFLQFYSQVSASFERYVDSARSREDA